MATRRGRGVLLALCLLSAACTGGDDVDPTPTPPADPLLEIVRENRAAAVIVRLAVPQKPDGTWSTAAIARAQRELLQDLDSGVRVVERYGRKVPQILLLVEEDALMELRQSPLVVNITLNRPD